MDSIVTIFQSVFGFFTQNEIFDIPLIVYFVGLATFGLVLSFLKGRNDK